MEAVAASYAPDHQPISPCKPIKTAPKRNHHPNHHSFTVMPSPTSTVHGGGGGHVLLFARPPPPSRSLSFSYPPPSSPPVSNRLGFNSVPPHHHQGQPPLLPLPKPYSSLSLPPPNSNMRSNKPKSSSLTPKKSSPKHPKRQDPNNKKKDSKSPVKSTPTPRSDNSSADDGVAIIGSTCSMGPDPAKLPRDVFVSKGSLRADVGFRSLVLGDLEKFSGSMMYAISPPPSSLPLPKFSLLRPKQLSCNAEAAGVDAGATDDLRRILRLP